MGQAAHVTTSSANLDVIITSPEPTPATKLSRPEYLQRPDLQWPQTKGKSRYYIYSNLHLNINCLWQTLWMIANKCELYFWGKKSCRKPIYALLLVCVPIKMCDVCSGMWILDSPLRFSLCGTWDDLCRNISNIVILWIWKLIFWACHIGWMEFCREV